MTTGTRPEVWRGDAMRAMRALDADATTTGRILRLLDLRSSPVDAPQPVPSPPPLPVAPRPAPLRARSDRAHLTARDASAPDQAGADRADPSLTGRSVEVVRSSVEPQAPRPLPPLSAVLPEPPEAQPLEPTDLLPPAQQRALLTAVCSGPAPSGEPDVDAAVARLARAEPVLTLPPRVVLTTRQGLQVLVDHGAGMVPFARDQTKMLRAVELVVGPDGLEIVHFTGTPLAETGAGPGPLWTWRPYRPPATAHPVLVLSDLGTARRPGPGEQVTAHWLRFAALAREAGCPVVALVPSPLHRVPKELLAAIAVVSWDRTTGMRDAVNAARAAARRIGGRRW